MKKFERATIPGDSELAGLLSSCWKNDVYTVFVYDAVQVGKQLPNDGFPEMWWLSIKRNDKEIIHDWRELQRIKNMIVGAEHEAVELYPAESRKVDGANQYHLFVLKDPNLRFPFGYYQRNVSGPKEAEKEGAKQRKL